MHPNALGNVRLYEVHDPKVFEERHFIVQRISSFSLMISLLSNATKSKISGDVSHKMVNTMQRKAVRMFMAII